MKKVWCIYKHTNKINGKGYIGKALCPPHWRWGIGGINYYNQPAFGAAIKKYGWENFEHAILLENLTAEEAIEAEKRLIEEKNTFCGVSTGWGYNMTRGGDGMGGWHHSEEEIERRSGDNSIFARPVISCIDGERFGSVTSAGNKYNINHSCISAVASGKEKTAIGKVWCYTDIWDSMTSEEQDEYIKWHLTSDKKGGLNHKSVSVINCQTGEIFETIDEAQRQYNCNTIYHALSDYDHTKLAGGQVWCRLEIWKKLTDKEKEQYIYERTNARKGEFNPSSRAVVNLITEEVFKTMRDASEHYDCSGAKICACCKKQRRTSGGQVWVYYDEYIEMTEIQKAHHLEDCLCRVDNPAKYGKAAKGIINLTKQQSYKTLKEASENSGISKYSLNEMCKRRKCTCTSEVWILEKDYNRMSEIEIEKYKEECLNNGSFIRQNRRIVNNTTSEVFDNIKSAAEAYHCDNASLHKCCKGKVKHVAGCSWSYLDT